LKGSDGNSESWGLTWDNGTMWWHRSVSISRLISLSLWFQSSG
jgi:hypothetical protein